MPVRGYLINDSGIVLYEDREVENRIVQLYNNLFSMRHQLIDYDSILGGGTINHLSEEHVQELEKEFSEEKVLFALEYVPY